ncbi:GCN5-related N-acetyltransferase [Hyphomicrobium denitrificans ATCC 51888]|jgi:predicted N-acetyltransferase YhbS|uniref:GCN5-related N-acetyltransferase n=1 Tax=Hyphomicrobium denitrificans (strain ATCC 51888 / DSM 1869 / NCIMB 11706 / TK 0415) TaxID=582899 RepID=D8JRX8_HYPDA|nr:N-acetyltransferase [Hyphomicrobium denitrificans]ADJ24196.1 GCN5-related N-acetyltransferase [Hyphomicrobium denitrificans ATCC 51888]
MSSPLVIRKAVPKDVPEISRLHARVFGPGRFARSAYRVREGKGHLSRYCLVAHLGGQLIASLRMTEITIGGRPGAALLGPVAVDPDHRNIGLGTKLMNEAIEAARVGGTSLVVLVGDDPYYGRFGFKVVPAGQIVFPGPVNPARLLVRELKDGALAEFRGLIVAIPSNGLHA